MPYSISVEVKKMPVLYTVLVSGIFFRLFHFIDNRSLWLDEIYVALNLLPDNFLQLTSPLLEYQQKAPIGFLWMVKTCVILFGNKEEALRLVPLLCGIAALGCFIPVCRHWLKPAGQVAALGIMAFAPPLVYHAVEVKQYGMELLATVLCLWLYVHFKEKSNLTARLSWGFAGALILWFSYSSIFILSGIGASVCLSLIYRRDWATFRRSTLPFFIWFVSFALHYTFITSKQIDQEWLLYWFRHYNSFMPMPLWSPSTMKWLIQHLYTMLDYPLGLLWNFNNPEGTALRIIMKMSFIPVSLAFAGSYAFFKEDKPALLLLTLPLLLTLLASALELYPFFERLLVFLSPLPILLIARGCDLTIDSFKAFRKVQFAIPVLLLTGGFTASVAQVIDPNTFGRYKKSVQKEALLYIDKNYKEGDVVYLYWNMTYAYRYYKKAYHLRYNATEGSDLKFESANARDYIHRLQPELMKLNGKRRVWVVYNKKLWNDIGEIESKPAWYNKSQPGEFLYRELASRARDTENLNLGEVEVHLFDFSSAP